MPICKVPQYLVIKTDTVLSYKLGYNNRPLVDYVGQHVGQFTMNAVLGHKVLKGMVTENTLLRSQLTMSNLYTRKQTDGGRAKVETATVNNIKATDQD